MKKLLLALLAALTFALLALVIGACSSTTSPDDPGELTYPDIPGIVVFYDFSGNLENETSGSHGGTRDGRPTYVADRHGTADSAILIANSTDPVQVPDHADLNFTEEVTLAAWVKPDLSWGTYCTVVDKDYTRAYSMGTNASTEPDTAALRGQISDEGFWLSDCVPTGTDVWSHVAFTFEDATGSGRFYVDGSYVGIHTRTVTLGTSDAPLWIGKSFHGDYFRGAIDQVAVFDRMLSPEEIQELYEFE